MRGSWIWKLVTQVFNTLTLTQLYIWKGIWQPDKIWQNYSTVWLADNISYNKKTVLSQGNRTMPL